MILWAITTMTINSWNLLMRCEMRQCIIAITRVTIDFRGAFWGLKTTTAAVVVVAVIIVVVVWLLRNTGHSTNICWRYLFRNFTTDICLIWFNFTCSENWVKQTLKKISSLADDVGLLSRLRLNISSQAHTVCTTTENDKNINKYYVDEILTVTTEIFMEKLIRACAIQIINRIRPYDVVVCEFSIPKAYMRSEKKKKVLGSFCVCNDKIVENSHKVLKSKKNDKQELR